MRDHAKPDMWPPEIMNFYAAITSQCASRHKTYWSVTTGKQIVNECLNYR